MKVTVDLNVLLDVAQNRVPHYHASEEVLHRARLGEFAAVLPGHALTTLHYIIEKYAGTSEANQTVDELLTDFAVHPVDKTNFQRARQLSLILKDFEDAVVAVVAEATGSDYIVTRNVPDFAGLPFPPSRRLNFWNTSPPLKPIDSTVIEL
jgi:predicted nucleic acid-binding protein